MEFPSKDIRTFFSVVKVGELKGKPKNLAEDIIEELSEEHSISLDRTSSLLAVVNASEKLNKRSRRDAKLLKKMEKLATLCADLKYDKTAEEMRHAEKGGALEEIKGATRRRATLMAEATEGLVQTPVVARVTTMTEGWKEDIRAGQALLDRRLNKGEVEKAEKMIGYVKDYENYFFVTSKKDGKTVGACSGAVLTHGNTSIFFGHYIAVDEVAGKKGIATELLRQLVEDANIYLKRTGKPNITNFFIEASQPHADKDEVKVWFFAKDVVSSAAVATRDGRYLKVYEQPDLEGGKTAVPMMAFVRKVGKEETTNLRKRDYWEMLECVYSGYKNMDKIRVDHLNELRVRAFERLTGEKLRVKELSDSKLLDRIFAAQREKELRLIKDPLTIFRMMYEPKQRIEKTEVIATKTKGWAKTASEAYGLLTKRLPAEEVYPPGTLERYVKELKNHVLVVARDGNGNVIGMMSGTFHSSKDMTYFYGHYAAVATGAEQKSVATQLYNAILFEADRYTEKNKLPKLGFTITEATKPHGEYDEAKIHLFSTKVHVKVASSDGKTIGPYFQPDLEDITGGKAPVQMALLIGNVNRPWKDMVPKAIVWGAVEQLYNGYQHMLHVPPAIMMDLKAKVLVGLAGRNTNYDEALQVLKIKDKKKLAEYLAGDMRLVDARKLGKMKYAKA